MNNVKTIMLTFLYIVGMNRIEKGLSHGLNSPKTENPEIKDTLFRMVSVNTEQLII